ncbi:MAG: type III pantothenate kinase [Oscillospiraceae bacterium]|nr:type III pantothenate kinase [Oscillospiraceae bacterium]
MLLTADVGNTNITLGAYSGGRLMFVSRLYTERAHTVDQYAVSLKLLLELHGISPSDFSGAVVSSVVPELSLIICGAVETLTGVRPLTVSPGVKTGLNILTDNPAEVGADLVAGAVAAAAKYPLPCLVMDLGTATKISVIDENGAFLGCTISPGVAISLEALSSRASLLPRISWETPRKVIGTNSVDSIQSGVVFGVASMLDGMCDKIEQELGRPAKTVVATGGLSKDIVKSCRREVITNPDLILEGLKIIYEKNVR